LLLQERAPRHALIIRPRPDEGTRLTAPMPPAAVRRLRSPYTTFPHAHFLSNSRYTVVLTNAGGGASFSGGRAVTRARSDATRDPGSQFLYLRDVRSGRVWSATHHPVAAEAEDFLVTFAADKATYLRREDDIGTLLARFWRIGPCARLWPRC
jgi:cyclic beta-1,2-glucan synthetase